MFLLFRSCKYNFINLALHEKDFGITAEWNFFANSHGKGACDGIGGTVKRHAYKVSLQKINNDRITTTQKLFDWAKTFFKNIDFDFCTGNDHEIHNAYLKTRFQNTTTIQNTRQFHCYIPVNDSTIESKLCSKDTESIKNVLSKEKLKKTKGTPKF